MQFAIDKFLKDNFFENKSNIYNLKENKQSGKSDLTLSVKGENLYINDFDNKGKCKFLKEEKEFGMNKSVDHIILQKVGDIWTAHLFEMKTSVGNRTWLEIKQKVRTCYMTIKAVAVFLGIEINDVCVYTTYEFDKFSDYPKETTNTKLYTPLLGKKMPNCKEEWDNNFIKLNFGIELKLKHKPIKMIKSTDGTTLIGNYNI